MLGSYVINSNMEFGRNLAVAPDPCLLFLDHLNNRNNSAISLYTDGSKMGSIGNVGAAFYSPELSISKSVGIKSSASIYTAECVAIRLALEAVKDVYDRDIYIYTDSLSIVSALVSPFLSSHTNPYFIDILILLEERVIMSPPTPSSIVYFYWIPSHMGIHGNEIADRLAKEGTFCKPSPNLLIPFTDLSTIFSQQAFISTINKLKEQAQFKGTRYFNIYYCDSPRPWFFKKYLPRDFITWINRCRSNHYHLRSSLARIGFVNDPVCVCGFPDQTLDHIIFQCPKFEDLRVFLLRDLSNLGFFPPYIMSSFLSGPLIAPLKIIYKFVKKLDICI